MWVNLAEHHMLHAPPSGPLFDVSEQPPTCLCAWCPCRMELGGWVPASLACGNLNLGLKVNQGCRPVPGKLMTSGSFVSGVITGGRACEGASAV